MPNPAYEEGAWSPALTFTGGSTGVSYASKPLGIYTRMGRVVVAHFVVNLSSRGTGAGVALVTGLPFDDAVGMMAVTMDQWARFASASALVFLGGGNAPTDPRGFNFKALKAAATSIGNLTYADFADNTNFSGTVVYTAEVLKSARS